MASSLVMVTIVSLTCKISGENSGSYLLFEKQEKRNMAKLMRSFEELRFFFFIVTSVFLLFNRHL